MHAHMYIQECVRVFIYAPTPTCLCLCACVWLCEHVCAYAGQCLNVYGPGDKGLKISDQHAGEKRGVAGLLLGRTERAARAAELQLCAQAR